MLCKLLRSGGWLRRSSCKLQFICSQKSSTAAKQCPAAGSTYGAPEDQKPSPFIRRHSDSSCWFFSSADGEILPSPAAAENATRAGSRPSPNRSSIFLISLKKADVSGTRRRPASSHPMQSSSRPQWWLPGQTFFWPAVLAEKLPKI